MGEDDGCKRVDRQMSCIVTFFARLRESGWLKTADEHKRAVLKRDIQPIIDIHREL